ncbi:UNVERIFIED_CONTAM: hypothetical protein K2H54_018070 [Gekko kuhli]
MPTDQSYGNTTVQQSTTLPTTSSQLNESVIHPATGRPVDQPAGVENTTTPQATTPSITTTSQINESVTHPTTGRPVDQPAGVGTTTTPQLTTPSVTTTSHKESTPHSTVVPTTTQTPKTTPGIGNFTVNFTVNNLKYKEDMRNSNSTTFASTEKVFVNLLNRELKKSSISPVFLTCKVTTLRSLRNGDATGVDAICTYRNDSAMPPFDRVIMYGEMVNQTQGFTKLGPYLPDETSLYVDAVSPTTTQTPKPTPATGHFAINFTINNLKYKEEMGNSNSTTFTSAERAIVAVLDPVLNKSSIGLTYITCKVTTLRPLRNGGATGVDAICTYRNDSAMPLFDRVIMYGEIVNQTQGFTVIGPYFPDKSSLYVDGYHELPPPTTVLPTTIASPEIQHFTVNYTITNLRHKPEMDIPNSRTYNSTARVVIRLLNQTLNESSIKTAFHGCQATAFRSLEGGDHTGVDAVCSYRSASPFDRKQIYHEIVNRTDGFSRMRLYTLDPDSLYMNGYHESTVKPPVLTTTPRPPTTQSPMMGYFTVKYTVTNLKYKPGMGMPNSKDFNSTNKTLSTLLGRRLQESSIGPQFAGCNVTAFRPINDGRETAVDTVCAYRQDSTTAPFNRERVYHDLLNSTNSFAKLGPYSLDQESLLVNGYHEAPRQPTFAPTTPSQPMYKQFTANFTVTNLRYKPDMANPSSSAFRSTNRTLTTLMGRLLNETRVGSALMACDITSLRSVDGGRATAVDSVCTYRSSSTTPRFDRTEIHQDLTDKSNGFSKLGPYALDSNSLRVDGVTTAPTTPRTPTVGHFTVNCTFTNLRYTRDLGMRGSRKFNSTERVMLYYMEPILNNTSIGPAFIRCQVENFRAAQTGNGVTMNAVCSYRKDLLPTPFDHEKVHREMNDGMNGGRKMGHYNVQENSLQVNDLGVPNDLVFFLNWN